MKPDHSMGAGQQLVPVIFQAVAENWLLVRQQYSRAPSAQNWRWRHPKLTFNPRRSGADEVVLERLLMRACAKLGRDKWANQIPVASGLGPKRQSTRSIDLVRRESESCFEFVELKRGHDADTPVYAAVEILGYAAIWLQSRIRQVELGYANNPILSASEIKLSVLAPQPFYCGMDFDWLQQGITASLLRIPQSPLPANFTFALQAFPSDMTWPGVYTDEQLVHFLEHRDSVAV